MLHALVWIGLVAALWYIVLEMIYQVHGRYCKTCRPYRKTNSK